MKKNYKLFIKVLLFLTFSISLFYVLFSLIVYISCYYSSKKVNSNQYQEFLRIKIYGSSSNFEGNTISGTFSIIDSNGNEIAVIERSWKGSYLAVEFAELKINNKQYIFPSRIYGKNQIIEGKSERKYGTRLEKYYNDNNQCMLLGYGSRYSERKALYKLSSFTTKQIPFIDFGNISNYTIDLSNCEPDEYYTIRKDYKGNIIIQKL